MFPVQPGAPCSTSKHCFSSSSVRPYSHLFTSTSISMCATPPGMRTRANTKKRTWLSMKPLPLQEYCAFSYKHTFFFCPPLQNAERCGSAHYHTAAAAAAAADSSRHNTSAQTHLRQHQHRADPTSARAIRNNFTHAEQALLRCSGTEATYAHSQATFSSSF